MERRRFLIVKRRVKGGIVPLRPNVGCRFALEPPSPLRGFSARPQPLNDKPRPPAPIKNQQAISLRFFPGPCGSACVQHAEPSLAETRCTANKLLYRKISHCLVLSLSQKDGRVKTCRLLGGRSMIIFCVERRILLLNFSF